MACTPFFFFSLVVAKAGSVKHNVMQMWLTDHALIMEHYEDIQLPIANHQCYVIVECSKRKAFRAGSIECPRIENPWCEWLVPVASSTHGSQQPAQHHIDGYWSH